MLIDTADLKGRSYILEVDDAGELVLLAQANEDPSALSPEELINKLYPRIPSNAIIVPAPPADAPNVHEVQQPDVVAGSTTSDHKTEADERELPPLTMRVAKVTIKRLERDLAEALASAQAELDLRKTTENQLNAEIDRRKRSEQALESFTDINTEAYRKLGILQTEREALVADRDEARAALASAEQTIETQRKLNRELLAQRNTQREKFEAAKAENVRLYGELDSVREELGDYASRILNLEHELNAEKARVGAKTGGLNLGEQTDAVWLLQQYRQLLNALAPLPQVVVDPDSRNELDRVLRAATEKGFVAS